MLRALNISFLAALMVTVLAVPARADDRTEAQDLVERSRLAFDAVIRNETFDLAREEMGKARGVLIIPRLFKAGFIIGGEGGSGVLLTRDAGGTWSQPAFYTMGAGSIGFQIGIKDSQLILILRNQKAVDAVLDNQVKLGADVSVAAGTLGAGMGGATTTAAGADILAFSLSRGVFGGAAVEGAVIARRNDFNTAYYGREVSPRDIVSGASGVGNPGADELRNSLARY